MTTSSTGILHKAIGLLNEQGPSIETTMPKKLQAAQEVATSFVFASADLKLTDREEDLLKSTVHKSRLTTNLTLFDLLFFDFHRSLSNLIDCAMRADWNREMETFETCYASLVQSETKDTSQLRDFLKNVINNLLASNSQYTHSAKDAKAEITATLIKDVLQDRVELFKKFAMGRDCQDRLFNTPLSELLGNEKTSATTNLEELRMILSENGWFLKIALNALSRTSPELNMFKNLLKDHINKFINLDFKRTPEFTACIEEMLTDAPFFPAYWLKIVHGSFAIYNTIIEGSYELINSFDTKETDLAIQAGKFFAEHPEIGDCGDKLVRFKMDNMVESSFHLTQAESDLVQELFNCPLDSEITLLDLLQFAFYNRMEALKGIIPKLDSTIKETQGQISARCLLLYVGLCQLANKEAGCVAAFQLYGNFAIFPYTFSQKIEEVFCQFRQKIEGEGVASHRRYRILKQFNETILPIRDLLIKILQSRGCNPLLIRGACLYQGSKALEQAYEGEYAILKRYVECIKSGYQSVFKEGLSMINWDVIMQTQFPCSSPISEKEMVSFGTALVKEQGLVLAASHKMNKTLEGALQGQIIYKSTKLKTQEEFFEKIISEMGLIHLYSCFIYDTLRLVSKRIFPSGVLTVETCSCRLGWNLQKHDKSLEHKPSVLLPKGISLGIKKILADFQARPVYYEDLLGYACHGRGHFIYTEWVESLIPMEGWISDRFENTLQELSKLKIELFQDLRNRWSALSLEQLQGLDLPAIKEKIFLEGLQLVRPVMILGDMLALLQKKHFLEEAAIIPFELADLMEPDGLDELLQELILSKTPISSAQTQLDLTQSNSMAEIEKRIAASPQKTAPPKRGGRRGRQRGGGQRQPSAAAVSPTVIPPTSMLRPEVSDLARLTKSRAVLRKLKELDFLEERQRGSHHILKGPQGGTVIVPDNANLPIGTRKSIAEQASSALNGTIHK